MSKLDEQTLDGGTDSGVAQVAQGVSTAAARVADVAGERGRGLAAGAIEEVRTVSAEAATQAHNVLEEARSATRARVESEVAGAASALQRFADQGQALIEGRPEDAGAILQYTERGVQRIREAARSLETGGPEGIMADVQGFARRRPGAFLALAGVGGFVIGRMLRSGALAESTEGPATGSSLPAPTPALPDYADRQQPEPFVSSSTGAAEGISLIDEPSSPAEQGFPQGGAPMVGEPMASGPGAGKGLPRIDDTNPWVGLVAEDQAVRDER